MQIHITLTDDDLRDNAKLDALRALLGRVTLAADGGTVAVPVIDFPTRAKPAAPAPRGRGRRPMVLTREAIDNALADCGGNREAAAKFLGITVVTLRNHMRRLGGYEFAAACATRGPLLQAA